jgi:predicted MFS family arabinose efflux permease
VADLISLTGVFFTASTILVAALGFQGATEGLKTGISAIALLLTGIWLICSTSLYSKLPDRSLASLLLAAMPLLFVICWVVALFVHVPKFRSGRSG